MIDGPNSSTPVSPKPTQCFGWDDRAPRVLRWVVIVLGALTVALGLGALVAPADLVQGEHWVLAAVGSRMFLACAAVMVGALAALVMLSYAMWRAGASRRRGRLASQEGAAVVEFAMVLPVMMTLVLLMVQSALLMAGNLCVHYSAFCAARTAIVQVPLNLAPTEPSNFLGDADSSAKIGRIKMSAAWALMPVSCGSDQYPAAGISDLQAGLGNFLASYNEPSSPGWLTNQLPSRLNYAMQNTVVTLAPPAAPTGLYAEHEDIVVGIEHTFYLSVPYMSRIFKGFAGADGRDLSFAAGQYGLVIRSGCRLPNEGVRDFVDVEIFGQ